MAQTPPCEAGTPPRVVAADDTLCWPLNIHDAGTVAQVRAIIQGAFAVLGLAADRVDDAERIVAELVGNAARHARPPVELWLHIRHGTAVTAIVDSSETMPIWPSRTLMDLTAALAAGDETDVMIDNLATFGRGLWLVRELSEGRCGAHLARTRAGSPGKAVWFSQPLPSRPA